MSQKAKSQPRKLDGAVFYFGLKASFSAALKAIYQTSFFGCLTNQQIKNQKPKANQKAKNQTPPSLMLRL